MSGLLRRLTRRPATADENRSPATASSEPAETPATAGVESPVPAGDEQPTTVLERTPGEQPADEPEPDRATRAWALGPTGWGRGRSKTSDDAPATAAESTPTEAEAPVATVPIAGQFPAAPGDSAIVVAPQPAPSRDLPAGVDPVQLEHAPASARRSRLRRRLRYLRSVRELLLRDLGGFAYEVHRTAGGTPQDSHARLQRAKAERIAALDVEVRALEGRLDEPHAATVLHEPGIGGTCPECHELHASDAHFCARCGTPLDAEARARRDAAIAAAAAPATGTHAQSEEPTASSLLWAGGREHKPEPAGEPAEDGPAAVTGEWLGAAGQPTTFDRAAQPEPDEAVADEPAAAADEPVVAAADEPEMAAADEPVVAAADEPVVAATDEPEMAAADEPAAAADEAVVDAADVPVVAPADEPVVARPKRPSRAAPKAPRRARKPAVPPSEQDGAEPAADEAVTFVDGGREPA